MRLLVLALVTCAADDPAARWIPPQVPETWDGAVDSRIVNEPAAEAPAPAECTIVLATGTLDCAATHGLMWCAGKGTNGCVPCPVEVVDGGLVRWLDCDPAAPGCETVEGDRACGGCGLPCPSAQHCVARWPAAPSTFATHCE